MDIEKLKVDEEYEQLLPPLSTEDYKNLEKSIERQGILYPLIINSNYTILDGYHRYRIAKATNIKSVPTLTKNFEDKFAEKEFVISINLNRRHLTNAQKAEIGLKLLEIEKQKARERQKELGKLGGRGIKKGTEEYREKKENLIPKSEQGFEIGKALEIVAKKVGVGKDSIWKAQKIVEKAKEDESIAKEWEKAKEGKKSINAVYKKALETEETETPELPKDKYNVIYADPPWYIANKEKYELKQSSTADLYHTTFRVIPIDDIPFEFEIVRLPRNENLEDWM